MLLLLANLLQLIRLFVVEVYFFSIYRYFLFNIHADVRPIIATSYSQQQKQSLSSICFRNITTSTPNFSGRSSCANSANNVKFSLIGVTIYGPSLI